MEKSDPAPDAHPVTATSHGSGSSKPNAFDVFVSYKREDRPRVVPIVEGLRHAGLRTWWDADIPGGASWRQTLIEHLDGARCVVVVWSDASTSPAGEFVQEEASRAKSRHAFLPVRIDHVAEPLGYAATQSIDLVDWSGDQEDPRFRDLIAAAETMISGAALPAPAGHVDRAPAGSGALANAMGFVQRYVPELLELLSAPKRFLAERLRANGSALDAAIGFAAVSYLLTFALELPVTNGNPLVTLISDVCFFAVLVVAFGYATYWPWRLLGATASAQKIFTIHCYLSGVIKLILTAIYVTSVGALKVGDQALYQELAQVVASGNLIYSVTNGDRLVQHAAFRVLLLVNLVGLGGMLLWVIAGWGAYRRLNGFSRLRSFLAFLLFCAFCVPIYIVTVVIGAALVR